MSVAVELWFGHIASLWPGFSVGKARAISLTLVPVLRMTTRNANSCFSIALVLNSCHMYILTSFFPLKLGQKWVYWIHWSGSSFHVTSVERSRRSPVEIERSYPTVPEHTLNENPVVKISVPRAALLPLPRSLSPSRHPLLKTLWNTPLSPGSLQCCLSATLITTEAGEALPTGWPWSGLSALGSLASSVKYGPGYTVGCCFNFRVMRPAL